MSTIALCGICGHPMSGSTVADLTKPEMLAGIYIVHLVDEHWDLVEAIRETTDDPGARMQLNYLMGGAKEG